MSLCDKNLSRGLVNLESLNINLVGDQPEDDLMPISLEQY